MRWVGILLFSVTAFFANHALAQKALYTLDPKTNSCIPADNKSPQKKPIKLVNYPHINRELLERTSICTQQSTCIFPERLDMLFKIGSIPTGPRSDHFLESEFKLNAEKSCLAFEDQSNSLQALREKLMNRYSLYPIETSQFYEFTAKHKENIDEYLETMSKASDLVADCLELKIRLSKSADVDVRDRYHQALAKGLETQKGCESIINDSQILGELQDGLSRLRKNLFILSLYDNNEVAGSADPNQVLSEVSQTKFDSQHLAKIKRPLKHPKFSPLAAWFGEKTTSYAEQAEQLEPLSKYERDNLLSHLQILSSEELKRKPDGNRSLDPQALAMADYVSLFERNPMLTHFTKGKISEAELVAAIRARQKSLKKMGGLDIDDLDYFNFSRALATSIRQLPPAQAGDMCLMVNQVLARRMKRKENLKSFLLMLALGDKLALIELASGFGAKLGVALIGGSVLGSGASAVELKNYYNSYSMYQSVCNGVNQDSQKLCDFSEGLDLQNDKTMGFAQALVFSGARAGAFFSLLSLRSSPAQN